MDFYSGSLLLTSLASLALGAFVFLKGRDKTPNITLGLFAATLALWCFGQFMGEILPHRDSILFWTRVGVAGAVFTPVFFLHFILALTGSDTRKRGVIDLVYALGILFLILDFTPLFVADVGPTLYFSYYPRAGMVYPFFALFVLASFGYGFIHLFLSCRSATGAKRNQLLYVILAALIGFAGGVTAFFPVWGIDFPILSHFALPLYVLITVYAILKHHLLDISIIVREGLIYSALTIFFAGFYALAILSTNYLFSSFVRIPPLVSVLMAVFVSVAVFQPLRDRVQGVVDHLFFMGEYRYQKTINDLSVENRKLFRDLLRADKLAALGTISAGMAHEIKNPLASVKALTQVLEENLGEPGFVRNYQATIERQIDRINDLVEKLLKFGHPPQLSLTLVDLSRVMEEVLGLLASQCRKGNIRIDKGLSPLPGIKGDPEQLSQVFMNLFLNALQAMPQGGTLSVKADVRGVDSVCVEVSDTGVGIPAENMGRIFDPFFSTKEAGSGMGLAVTYRIVKEHGGEIQVESQPGKGTKFKLCLPIKPKPSV